MIQRRLALLQEVDLRAKSIASEFVKGNLITAKILRTIVELYSSAQVEQLLKDEYFEAAYHAPVTGELEFFISRILFYYSESNKLQWKIHLRKQKSKVAPDIRISKNGETISVIEIKAKGGWIQPFLSLERYERDVAKYNTGNYHMNPEEVITKQRLQLSKYESKFGLQKNDIYYFLPTLALVHREKYASTISDYYEYFSSTSYLPKENFILLSNNRRLDLSSKPNLDNLEPTDNFERMIREISKK